MTDIRDHPGERAQHGARDPAREPSRGLSAAAEPRQRRLGSDHLDHGHRRAGEDVGVRVGDLCLLREGMPDVHEMSGIKRHTPIGDLLEHVADLDGLIDEDLSQILASTAALSAVLDARGASLRPGRATVKPLRIRIVTMRFLLQALLVAGIGFISACQRDKPSGLPHRDADSGPASNCRQDEQGKTDHER